MAAIVANICHQIIENKGFMPELLVNNDLKNLKALK